MCTHLLALHGAVLLGVLSTQEREELSRLRRENKVLREEREILKKAAVGSTGQCNTG